MKNEKIDEEEIWSAIRYLDPDEQKTDKETNIAVIVAVVSLVVVIGSVWVLVWLR